VQPIAFWLAEHFVTVHNPPERTAHQFCPPAPFSCPKTLWCTGADHALGQRIEDSVLIGVHQRPML